MTMKKTAITDLGKALEALYSWNSSADIEALQVLLCIDLFADSQGYAQLVDVRREVGIPYDRMTRCVRLLMGGKKSVSLPLVGGGERRPLIDVATYDDSPSVKRIALTPLGRDIVSRILTPLIERQQRIDELEKALKGQDALEAAVRAIGYDPQKLSSGADSDPNAFFNARARGFLSALIGDVSQLSAQQIYDLGLPTVQQCLKDIPGFWPGEAGNDNRQVRDAMGFNFALINHLRSDEDKSGE